MMCIGHHLLNVFMSELLLRDQSRQKIGDGGYLQGRCEVLGPIESRHIKRDKAGYEGRRNWGN